MKNSGKGTKKSQLQSPSAGWPHLEESRRQHCPNCIGVEPLRPMQVRSPEQNLAANIGHRIEDGKTDIGRDQKESTGPWWVAECCGSPMWHKEMWGVRLA